MSQVKKLYEMLKDGQPHRTDQIMREVYGDEHLGVARIGARIYDLKNQHGAIIKSWPDSVKQNLTWYQLVTIIPVYSRVEQNADKDIVAKINAESTRMQNERLETARVSNMQASFF